MYSAEEIKNAMGNRRMIDPQKLSSAALKKAGCIDMVAAMPEDFNERVQYMGNVLVQMLTRKPKDDRLRFVAGALCQSLSYLLNSTSWQQGELFDFDEEELSRKLCHLVQRRDWE